MDSPPVAAPADVRPYRSNRFWTRTTILLVALDALNSVRVLVAQAWVRHAIDVGVDLRTGFSHAVDEQLTTLNWVSPLLSITSGIAFLFWLHHAFSNLSALGSTKTEVAPGQQATPRAAVICWFIPIANLVLGYRTVRHLWRESQPIAAEPTEHPTPRHAPILGWWWGLFIARNFALRIFGGSRDPRSLQAWVEHSQQMVIPLMLNVAAAILCIYVVRTIDHRQQEQNRDIELRVPVPPDKDRLR